MYDTSPLLLAVFAVLVAGSMFWERLQPRLPARYRYRLGDFAADDPVTELSLEEHQALLAADAITYEEYKTRLDLVVDGRVPEITQAVTPISGIGPRTAEQIAAHFDSIEDVRAASQAELEAVPGVGDQYAQAIQARLQDE